MGSTAAVLPLGKSVSPAPGKPTVNHFESHLFVPLFDMRQCLTRVRMFRIRSRGILGFVSEAQRLPKPICSASRLRG